MNRSIAACGVLALAGTAALGQSVSGTAFLRASCASDQSHPAALGSEFTLTAHGECPAPRFGGIASINDASIHVEIFRASLLTDVTTDVDFFGTFDGGGSGSGSGDFTLTANDLVFTNVAQPASHEFLNTSVNYVLAAHIATQGHSNCSATGPAAGVSFNFQTAGSNASGALTLSGDGAPTGSGVMTDYPNDGSVVPLTTSGGLTTTVDLNGFTMITSTHADILYCDFPPAEIGAADAMMLLRLPCGTPVFNLPPGYTVNSAQLGIVDNIWGGLVIMQHPADASACSGSAEFTVAAQGSGPFQYQWQRMPMGGAGFITVHDGPNADPVSGAVVFTAAGATADHLQIGGATGPFSVAQVRCEISNACSNHDSDPAALRICAADVNCDGLVDFGDYLEFLNRFDIGDLAIDFNGDGLVDFSDYLQFLNLYNAGC